MTCPAVKSAGQVGDLTYRHQAEAPAPPIHQCGGFSFSVIARSETTPQLSWFRAAGLTGFAPYHMTKLVLATSLRSQRSEEQGLPHRSSARSEDGSLSPCEQRLGKLAL